MTGSERVIAAGRVFADHYQFVICEEPDRPLKDTENWSDDAMQLGFAGAKPWRMIGTDADLNDHWIELALADAVPDATTWDRIIACDFETLSGAVHVMGILDADPPISAQVSPGAYAVYICARNLGIDQNATGELDEGAAPLTDAEIAERQDLERYRVVLVPGAPPTLGILHDQAPSATSGG